MSKNKNIKSVEYFFNKIEEEALEHCDFYKESSVIDYLSDLVKITTYDSALDLMFVRSFNQTVKAILEKKQELLLEDDFKYKDYITSLNMPFFDDAVEWGSSIRFCWFWASKHRPYEAFSSTHRGDTDFISDTDELINFFTAFSIYTTQVLEVIDNKLNRENINDK